MDIWNLFLEHVERKIEESQANLDENIGSTFQQMNDVLHLDQGWIVQDVLRDAGGALVKGLSYINNFVEDIVMTLITMNGFYESQPMIELMDKIRPLVWGLFLISLTVLGFQFIFNKVSKRHEVFINLLLALSFIIIVPDLTTQLSTITKAGIDEVSPESESLSANLIKSNILDVGYYASKNFNFSGSKNGDANSPPKPYSSDTEEGTTNYKFANKLTTKSLNYLDYSQKLLGDEDENDVVNQILTRRMVASGDGSKIYYLPLSKAQVPTTNLGRESYYRYHINWLILVPSLIITAVALAITIVKIGRLFFDIAFHQIFGTVVAATDISSGQRTKKVLGELINSFAVLFIMVLLLRLFILYSTWVGGLQGHITAFGVMLMLISGAWALIDAPNIVERLLGIDAGLRSSYGSMVGTYAGIKMAGMPFKAAKSGLNTINNGARKVTNASSSAVGMMKGIKSGMSQDGSPGNKNKGSGDSGIPTPEQYKNNAVKNLSRDSAKGNGINNKPLTGNTLNDGNNEIAAGIDKDPLNNKVEDGQNITSNANEPRLDRQNSNSSVANQPTNENTSLDVGNNSLANRGNNDNEDYTIQSANGHEMNPSITNEGKSELKNNVMQGADKSTGISNKNAPSSLKNNAVSPNSSASVNYDATSDSSRKDKQNKVEKQDNGYIKAQHHNTLSGSTRVVQEAKESHAKGHNTGYNIGKTMNKMKPSNLLDKGRKIENRGKRN